MSLKTGVGAFCVAGAPFWFFGFDLGTGESSPYALPLRLTWRLLYSQFGAHPSKASDKRTIQNFRSRAVYELKKIKPAWPGLNYSTAKGVLILHPSTPVIAPLNQAQLTS